MTRYIIKRVIMMFFVFFIVATICFTLIRLLPNEIPPLMGDQAYALKAMREAWGYNKPIIVQYGIYLKNVFTEFNFGYCTKVAFMEPVGKYLASKLPATISVNVWVLISIPFGFGFGIWAAVRKNKIDDHIITLLTMIVISVPSFVYAFVLQYLLGFRFKIFPPIVAPLEAGMTYFSPKLLYSYVLPVLTLSFGSIAYYTRSIRAELTENLTSEYMLLARAKGLTRAQATIRHALKNALVPMAPIVVGEVVGLLGGSLIIEKIFSIPGVGSVYINSINNKDYDLFLFVSMFYLAIGLVAGLLGDLSYGIIDPRIRMGGGKNNAL